jgi:hypothetical protein
MRFLRTSATVAAALVVATPAAAQDPGVFIDPESPTAKEYALPLENERRLADPSTPSDAAVPQGQRVSPAFGEGIAPAGSDGGGGSATSASGAGGSSSARSGGGGASGGSAGSGAGDADRAAAATVRAATANPGAPGGDASDTLVIAGGALAVLVLGAGAGLFLRRRRV